MFVLKGLFKNILYIKIYYNVSVILECTKINIPVIDYKNQMVPMKTKVVYYTFMDPLEFLDFFNASTRLNLNFFWRVFKIW